MNVLRAALLVAAATIVPGARAQPITGDVSDLPLTEVPAAGATRAVAVLLTGDGGWQAIDKGVAAALASHGVAVVGLNARSYLSGANRTPDDAARDVARVLRYYGARWGDGQLLLVGYSRGADMLPFVASRLPADLRARTGLVAMLGLARAASFEFHWTDMVRDTHRATDLPTAPELAKLRGLPLLCVYGADERDSGCRDADPSLVTRVERGGAHHFDGDYAALGDIILAHLAPRQGA